MRKSPGQHPVDDDQVTPRIVGIGASAGGLAALEQCLARVPPNSGLAYVVVQHLDPTHKAFLAELLQRFTVMPVCQAQDAMHIAPDSVYVIPPNTELSVAGGLLHLQPPPAPRGMRLPINALFSSLARDQSEHAIVVILSGMGSDGTQGVRAVKALGGLTIAQLPESAQFDAMPKSAIETGCVDIIVPPEEIVARILAYIGKSPGPQRPKKTDDAPVDHMAEGTCSDPLAAVVALLLARGRHDFSSYKPSTLRRRIERRMAIHSISSLARYADFLEKNPQEIDLLFKELLIGVTSFFRDAAVWQHLAETTLPALLASSAREKKLRAWVVGCSTGEEAYSLAIVFEEAMQRLQLRDRTLQIFATDLSPDAIATARRGVYPASIDTSVSAERLALFFTCHEGRYGVSQRIRDMVLFAQQDVVLDPPFTKLDILSCRNLMIYFDAALQRRLLPLFHYSLRAGGILLLGNSETTGQFDRLFTPIESKLRLYARHENTHFDGVNFLAQSFPPLSTMKMEQTVPTSRLPAQLHENLQKAADNLLLQVYAPPAVVVNSSGDIVYISGRTGKYLEPAAGKVNWNFHAMARDGIRLPIATGLQRAAEQSEPLQLTGLQAQSTQGSQLVDVTIQALKEPIALRGMFIIVFRDVPAAAGRRRKTPSALEASHAAALQRCHEEILALREEARISREELQSTNEELQSTNEELQSANEELTTSKEEMQSMNEELQTINAEMQRKLDDLSLAQSDMKNLLNSTDIAMLFLDQELNVSRYTERTSKIINLRESDVGRPLSDLTTSLQYPALQDDACETLRTLVPSEKQILSNDGRWFAVRIMPYRRLDNVIDGAVITFVDITAAKELELRLRRESRD